MLMRDQTQKQINISESRDSVCYHIKTVWYILASLWVLEIPGKAVLLDIKVSRVHDFKLSSGFNIL